MTLTLLKVYFILLRIGRCKGLGSLTYSSSGFMVKSPPHSGHLKPSFVLIATMLFHAWPSLQIHQTTIFIPLTFVVGLYGMNFKYMPELEWPWGYPLVLTLMLTVTVFMLIYFRRKR